MDFTPMDALAYRSLSPDEYAERRSSVIGFAKELPEDFTIEQAESVDAELGIIESEDERRAKLSDMEKRTAKNVATGEGKITEEVSTEEAGMKRAASLGEHFVQFRKEHPSSDNRYVAPAYSMRAAGDPSVIFGAGNVLAATQFDRNPIGKPVKPLSVLDLFARKTISEPVYSWLAYSSTAGAAGTTAEGVVKNKLTYTYSPKSVTLKKITGLIKMTEEMFMDTPYLVDAINDDLINDLNAARQATALADLLGTSGVQTMTGTGSTAVAIFQDILAAAADVEEDTGFAADAVVVTPATWLVLRSALNSNNDFYAGNPFGDSEYSRLFEMRFVKSADMTSGHILVGSFAAGAELVSKDGSIRVDSTTSNDVDFEKNLISVRAEAREVLAVKRPACFENITIGS